MNAEVTTRLQWHPFAATPMKQTLRLPHGLRIINPADSRHLLLHMRIQLGPITTSLSALGSLSLCLCPCLCPCLLTLDMPTASDSRPSLLHPATSTPPRSLVPRVMSSARPVVVSSSQTSLLIMMPTSEYEQRPRRHTLGPLSASFGLLDPLTQMNRGSSSCTTVLFGSTRGLR